MLPIKDHAKEEAEDLEDFEASEADLLEAPPTEGFLGTETDLDTGDWLLWTEKGLVSQ